MIEYDIKLHFLLDLQLFVPSPNFNTVPNGLENLENEKCIFQTWKDHGILKKGQNHGKIMEFQNIHMEKSWKKKLALRAFHPILTHCLGYYN